jgi:soluble lytic murein transglycosylase-like protein
MPWKLTSERHACRGGWVFLGVWLLMSSGLSRADVWAFVDERGVPRFAAERLDSRYELFWRAAPAAVVPGLPGAAPAPVASAPAVEPESENSPLRAQNRLLAYLDIAPGYKAVRYLLREASDRHGLDYALLKAVIATESGFDPQAVSPRGAIGLMQLMPATAQRFGVAADRAGSVESKLTDPRINIGAGARYLQYLLRRYPGQTELVLASYNAGEGAVARAGNRIPEYPETRNYVQTVMQLYGLLKPPVPAPAAPSPVAAAPAPAAPAPVPGGARGRSTMLPPLTVPPPAARPASASGGEAIFF